MLNRTLDELIGDYVNNMKVEDCEKLLHGKGEELKYEFSNSDEWNQDYLGCADYSSKVPMLIQLGEKKGVICISNQETNFYCDKPIDSFTKFLMTINFKYMEEWKKAIKCCDCENMQNRVNKALGWLFRNEDKLDEYNQFISNEDFSDENYIEILNMHFNEVAPELIPIYYQLIAYTFFLKTGNDKYNCFSNMVRNYLSNNPNERKQCMKIFIKTLLTKHPCSEELREFILKNPSIIGIEKDDICKNNECWLRLFMAQRRCFTYNDYICVDDNFIKEIVSELKNKGYDKSEKEVKDEVEVQKYLYEFENYEGSTNSIVIDDNNIDELRNKYSGGLHFVVGDLHKCWQTLDALLQKIKYNPDKDHIYFLGDYYGGDNEIDIDNLLKYLSNNFQEDYTKPGFHLILGNHEYMEKALANLPDIIVLRMNKHNFYMAHASFYNKVIDIIYDDMEQNSSQKVFSYKIDRTISSNEEKGSERYKCWRMKWSAKGTFVPENQNEFNQNTGQSVDEKACIIHGHTPFFFFDANDAEKKYGNNSLFWENQKIWFSEDMRSFNIDSNIKGEKDSRRALSCLCLEVLDDMDMITKKKILRNPNGVFSVEYQDECAECQPDDKEINLNKTVKNCADITFSNNKLEIKHPQRLFTKEEALLLDKK